MSCLKLKILINIQYSSNFLNTLWIYLFCTYLFYTMIFVFVFVQKQYEHYLGELTSMKRLVLWLVLLLWITVVVITIIETQYILKSLPWHLSILLYVPVSYHLAVGTLYWFINCIIFAHTGTIITKHLITVSIALSVTIIKLLWFS